MRARPLDHEIEALDAGRAHAELADVSLTLVAGADARAWLDDLVTTDVRTLRRFETRPSLLLTATGRIRAAFHVVGLGDREFALAQPVDQPDAVGDLLSPYVLSSDVTITPARLRLFALPGREHAPPRHPDVWRPSVLGGGLDLLVANDEAALRDVREELLQDGLVAAGRGAVEERRIRRGTPAFPADLDLESLPAEAGLDRDPVTDRTKGCFLGQEAVAKVANLGHPTRVVIAVEAGGPVREGERVLADGGEAGSVTSAAGRFAVVRVRWDAREAALVTASGTRLRTR